jgi:hypothetical protein
MSSYGGSDGGVPALSRGDSFSPGVGRGDTANLMKSDSSRGIARGRGGRGQVSVARGISGQGGRGQVSGPGQGRGGGTPTYTGPSATAMPTYGGPTSAYSTTPSPTYTGPAVTYTGPGATGAQSPRTLAPASNPFRAPQAQASNGGTLDLDPDVAAQIAELDALLGL